VLSNVPSSGCHIRSTSLLTLNAVTGVKTLVGTLPFDASDALYDAAGHPVAVIGFLPQCPTGVTTTTVPPTTTSSQIHLRIIRSKGASGGGSFSIVGGSNSLSLYKWEDGGAVKIASGIDTIAYVQFS
jgi:hypothetical protein